MAYDVDFLISKDACEITTDFKPYLDEKNSIILRNEDFFNIAKFFSEECILKEAWQVLKSRLDDKSKEIMKEIEESEHYSMINFNEEID